MDAPSHATGAAPSADRRLADLIRLKNFAVARGLAVADDTLREIGDLEEGRSRVAAPPAEDALASDPPPWSKADLVRLDLLIRSVSEATYPVTIDNVGGLLDGARSFVWVHRFLGIGVGAALLSSVGLWLVRQQPDMEVWKVLTAIMLGLVGAVLYVMLPNGRINLVAGLDRETVVTNVSRIVIGGIMGFVIFLVMPDLFVGLKSGDQNSAAPATLKLLAPLVGGYSISLVIGLLGKAVTAIELTLGLDDKKNVAAVRR